KEPRQQSSGTSFESIAKLSGTARNKALQEMLQDRLSRSLMDGGVVIVIGETGSGKSTQATIALEKLGFIVRHAVPRRALSEALSQYISELGNTKVGQEVGFGHGLAEAISKNTRHSIETHGRFVVRGLDSLNSPDQVLVIDEVHEPNELKETLVAEAIQALKDGTLHNLVLMSATPNIESLLKAFPGAQVIELPPNKHFVEFCQRDLSLRESDIIRDLAQRESGLAFCSGKSEIYGSIRSISEVSKAQLLPWHSQLPMVEQRKVFESYPSAKCIFSTNIAQTGITIADITRGYSSPYVRRATIKYGTPTLEIAPKSRSEVVQEMGRLGKSCNGVFNWYGPDLNELPDHAPAQIQNIALESIALKLLARGKRIERLEYLEPPSSQAIHLAYRALEELGLTGPQRHITKLGERVAQIPVDVNLGVMLVKAEQHLAHAPEVLRAAIDIAAIVDSEGIIQSTALAGTTKSNKGSNGHTTPKAHKKRDWNAQGNKRSGPADGTPKARLPKWQKLCGMEQDSDLLAQLRVFRAALKLTPEQCEKLDVDPVA
ncbi:MAG: DEAD/DEAH box helicase, partial [Bdellovibrionales bacterium]|nr:DEAD/DEAH box helicase [Bdellovibrionales bacterium]